MIIEARIEEIFTIIQDKLKPFKILERSVAGVVITGGTALTDGIEELAETVLGTQVRIGSPYGVYGLTDKIDNPIYSTAVGLALWGMKENFFNNYSDNQSNIESNNFISKIRTSMKNIAKEFFS
jgi:cell division protein FtsA